MPTTALLSTTYFGPIQWYQKLNRYGDVVIEQHDHFVKQTYRNRCVIAAAQGLQSLTVPVTVIKASDHNIIGEESHRIGEGIGRTGEDSGRPGDSSSCREDVLISDHGNWRHLHWNALCSAYGESPFFDYYADDLRPFFTERWERLFDFNLAIIRKLCELLDIQPHVRLSGKWTPESAGSASSAVADFRSAIRPKHPLADPEWQPRRYHQVFERKYGFSPNLSVLDLLFNTGNEAVLYL